MPSVSALCQLLALGLLVETRLELVAQKQPQHDTARRSLENGDGASFVTVAQAEALLGDLVEAAVEAAVDRVEAVEAAVDSVDATVTKMCGELDAVTHKGARDLANATEHFGARLIRLESDVERLRSRGGARRRAQTRPQSCDPTAFQTRTDEAMAPAARRRTLAATAASFRMTARCPAPARPRRARRRSWLTSTTAARSSLRRDPPSSRSCVASIPAARSSAPTRS